MINCRDAKHLFCRYLDGELSPSLQTELHAHRLQCNECQNELALLEACGDVIAYDRREPTVSASFTDRVLLARRAHVKPVRRPWSRTLLIFGSPMAAAASIALMFSIIRPMPNRLPTVVAPYTVAMPAEVRDKLPITREQSPQALVELNATPSMSSASIFEALLAPVVEKTRSTADGAKRTTEDLFMLFHDSLSNTNEQLVAAWRSQHPDTAGEQVGPPAPAADSSLPDTTNSPIDDTLRDPL